MRTGPPKVRVRRYEEVAENSLSTTYIPDHSRQYLAELSQASAPVIIVQFGLALLLRSLRKTARPWRTELLDAAEIRK